jgi:hypothetical protein
MRLMILQAGLPLGSNREDHEMEFAYSTHKTFGAAHAAVYDYFASGEVSECEFVGIRRRTTSKGFRYDVMLRG